MARQRKIQTEKTQTPQAGAKAQPGRRGAMHSNSSLLGEPRRMKMLDWFQEVGSARVRDLAEAFSVSEVTIRQDLERLESEGHIVREHGGAYLKSVPQQVRAMALHHLVNMDAKRRIGRAAAALVEDGETIILDSGSTTTEVAMNLGDREHLTVITNALNIALVLGAMPTCTVHMPGGQFKAPTLSVSGERSADYFKGLFAQKLFLATAAVSFEAGLTFPALADIPVKRAMIETASRVYLVADSSKIGKTSFSSLGGIENIHALITDNGIRDEDHRAFTDAGIEVIVA
ncbi:DeoR/GlpR family DNA-binding transcription regulator [Sphingomonas sp. MMSM20]|uniref:DeoR/GlpR family DNA-binding transcription regulator n=1 Tax=Sphingomonas lycopersici TaxID=2951807 RepID=UPI002237A8AC|nr:DeoR/GlpR family DNA-binding transcription regulator [Sphingomonas lycopersici]MCW6530468.1 DeoR/GlpR family DNA-binding transcription regulator [Sphingomonas lycopersici]